MLMDVFCLFPVKLFLIGFTAYTYAPLLIGLTKIIKKIKNNPETNQLEENLMIKSHFTTDHRYLDGYFAAKIAEEVIYYN
jgi:hypothetical protein